MPFKIVERINGARRAGRAFFPSAAFLNYQT
jgi:hypothetical protein